MKVVTLVQERKEVGFVGFFMKEFAEIRMAHHYHNYFFSYPESKDN